VPWTGFNVYGISYAGEPDINPVIRIGVVPNGCSREQGCELARRIRDYLYEEGITDLDVAIIEERVIPL
jgi:hypothetical protein